MCLPSVVFLSVLALQVAGSLDESTCDAAGGCTAGADGDSMSVLQRSREMPVAMAAVQTVTAAASNTGGPDELAPGWRAVYFYEGPDKLQSTHKSESQVGQDFVVQSILGCKRSGFFLDLAANDYLMISNTFELETEFDWKGVCMEPNTGYLEGLLKRKCTYIAAAVGSPKDQVVNFVMDGDLGGIKEKGFDNEGKTGFPTENLHLVPLNDVLELAKAPQRIDYFSLDVEGAESIVMQGFDWDKFRFTLMTVERPKPDLKDKLTKHDYAHIRNLSSFDDELWMDKTDPNFLKVWGEWNQNVPAADLGQNSCMTQFGYPKPALF